MEAGDRAIVYRKYMFMVVLRSIFPFSVFTFVYSDADQDRLRHAGERGFPFIRIAREAGVLQQVRVRGICVRSGRAKVQVQVVWAKPPRDMRDSTQTAHTYAPCPVACT